MEIGLQLRDSVGLTPTSPLPPTPSEAMGTCVEYCYFEQVYIETGKCQNLRKVSLGNSFGSMGIHSGSESQENDINRTYETISAEKLQKFGLKSNHQQVDSTQIASNIRAMSRLQLWE